MKKVLINTCYGGFGLSPAAIKSYHEKIKIPCYLFYKIRTSEEWNKLEDGEKLSSTAQVGFSFSPNGEQINSFYKFNHDRTNKTMISVVEELGCKANGPFAQLKVVKIPDYIDFTIEEENGNEWIAEKHRIWS